MGVPAPWVLRCSEQVRFRCSSPFGLASTVIRDTGGTERLRHDFPCAWTGGVIGVGAAAGTAAVAFSGFRVRSGAALWAGRVRGDNGLWANGGRGPGGLRSGLNLHLGDALSAEPISENRR